MSAEIARTFSVAVFQRVAVARLFLVAFVVAPGKEKKHFKIVKIVSSGQKDIFAITFAGRGR